MADRMEYEERDRAREGDLKILSNWGDYFVYHTAMNPQQEALNNVTTSQAVSLESIEYQQRHPHPVLLGGAIGVSDPPPAGWRTASCPQLFLCSPPIWTPLPPYMNWWTCWLPPHSHLKLQALFTTTYSTATLSSQREQKQGAVDVFLYEQVQTTSTLGLYN